MIFIQLSLLVYCFGNRNMKIGMTRSDILQGQALFRGVKQLRRCLGMLDNFEKFSFPSIEKDGQKTKRQKEKKKKRKKEKKKKRKKEKKKKRKKEKKIKIKFEFYETIHSIFQLKN